MDDANTPLCLRIVIADDHHVVRTALRSLLETQAGMEIVGEGCDGREAVGQALVLQPDVMLVDVAMPKLNGIEVARRVTAACARTRVLMLTALEGPEYVEAALAAGALGYVPKSAAAADLVPAIRLVASGRRFVHPLALSGAATAAVPPTGDAAGLSGREANVIQMVALGYTSKEIAQQLAVSVKTVETYKLRAGAKIGARSRVDLVRFALAIGWLAGPRQPEEVLDHV